MVSRIVTLALGVVLAALPAAGRRVRAGEFVGVNHPAGELRLRLEPGGRFLLLLSVWDPVVGAFVANRELAGHWRCTLRGIQLRAPSRTLTYVGSTDAGGGWRWERSSLPTFADGIVLVRGKPGLH